MDGGGLWGSNFATYIYFFLVIIMSTFTIIDNGEEVYYVEFADLGLPGAIAVVRCDDIYDLLVTGSHLSDSVVQRWRNTKHHFDFEVEYP
jgi:hypothetical protein